MCIQTYHSGHHNGLEYYYIGKNNKLKLVDREKIGFRRTLGFELECDGFPSYDVAVVASDFVDDVYGNYAHCERDRSLGFNSLELKPTDDIGGSPPWSRLETPVGQARRAWRKVTRHGDMRATCPCLTQGFRHNTR